MNLHRVHFALEDLHRERWLPAGNPAPNEKYIPYTGLFYWSHISGVLTNAETWRDAVHTLLRATTRMPTQMTAIPSQRNKGTLSPSTSLDVSATSTKLSARNG